MSNASFNFDAARRRWQRDERDEDDEQDERVTG